MSKDPYFDPEFQFLRKKAPAVATKLLSTNEILDLLDCGDELGYMVTERVAVTEIADGKLRKFWAEAKKSLDQLNRYLDEAEAARENEETTGEE
jgi:hypothetical protein